MTPFEIWTAYLSFTDGTSSPLVTIRKDEGINDKLNWYNERKIKRYVSGSKKLKEIIFVKKLH